MTAYHPQANGLIKRSNKTLVARLSHCITNHRKDWYEYAQTLTYACNAKANRWIKTTTFSLVLSRRPPSLLSEVPRTKLLSESYGNTQPRSLWLYLLACIKNLKNNTHKSLATDTRPLQTSLQEKYQSVANTGSRIVCLNQNAAANHTFVWSQRRRDSVLQKFTFRVLGSYNILNVRDSALTLLESNIENMISIDCVAKAHDLKKTIAAKVIIVLQQRKRLWRSQVRQAVKTTSNLSMKKSFVT